MSSALPSLRCERAGAEHAEGLLALFEGAGSGCYCQYWHFDGDKNAWLERCYVRPEENRAALTAALAKPVPSGVVALTQDRVCGWLKLEPALALAKLYAQKPYKSLPLAGTLGREDVYAVGCLYVDPAHRGQGVATELLRAAIAIAKSVGARAVEAFPRGTPSGEKLRPDEIWMGPEALFLQAGFQIISDFRPYPVLRLHLPPS